jgi:hypothetical protein
MILAGEVFFAPCENSWFQPAGKSGASAFIRFQRDEFAFAAIW